MRLSRSSYAAILILAAFIDGCASEPMTVAREPASEPAYSVLDANHPVTGAPLYRMLEGSAGPAAASCGSSAPAPTDSVRANAIGAGGTLFVSDHASATPRIEEYYGSGTVPKPFASITADIDGPDGLTVGPDGTLYVANRGADDVLAFAQGAASPNRLISNEVNNPLFAAADNEGNVYVINAKGGPILVFPPGSSSSNPRQLTGFYYPTSLAFDSSWNMYVVDQLYGTSGPLGAVLEIEAGSSGASMKDLRLKGLDFPVGIAIDSSNDIFVSNLGTNTVAEYAAGSKKPMRTISKGVCDPVYLALNARGNLFVANYGGGKHGDVTVYSAGSGALIDTLTVDMDHVSGVAVNPNLAPPMPTPHPAKSPKPTPTP